MNDVAEAVVQADELILVTGAAGFIGTRVVENLVARGFRNLRCFVRPSSDPKGIAAITSGNKAAHIEVVEGNLVSREDCLKAAEGAVVIYHLAAGRGEKSFPDAFINSVVTTRNVLEATLTHHCLKRFVSVSSFSVYGNPQNGHGDPLDESWAIEGRPELRGEAYCFAKVRQDELVMDYGRRHGIPYVIVRPGYVYGPGNEGISARVGVGTFGIFLHLGGGNRIPLSYVENCAEAIVLAGITKGVEGETFNVVDDDLPTSRDFLRLYKRNVKSFPSVYVPHVASYLLCSLWEKYSSWSEGQLPPVFNRRRWQAEWKSRRYSNHKLKDRLGWRPKISTAEGLRRHFASCREKQTHA